MSWKKFFQDEDNNNKEIKDKKKVSIKENIMTKVKDSFKGDEDLEEYEEEYYEEYEETNESKKEEGLLSKLKSSFSSKEEFPEKYEDNYYEEDYYEEYEGTEKPKKESGLLSKLKSSFSSKEESLEKYEDNYYEEDYYEEYEGTEKPKKESGLLSKLKNSFGREEGFSTDNKKEGIFSQLFKNKDDKDDISEEFDEYYEDIDENKNQEDELEIEYYKENEIVEFEDIDEEDLISNNLENKNEKNEELIDLGAALKNLGIDTNKIKDVDLFEDRGERKLHPTLAAVKVKRLRQDKDIEELSNKLVFEDSKDSFRKELFEKISVEADVNDEQKEDRVSKNNDSIFKLNKDFNTISRKEEKISKENAALKERKDIDYSTDLKKIQQELSKEDTGKDINIREADQIENRREKLKYTTIDEVLAGADDLFEDDIDRVSKKLVGSRFDETREIESEEIKQFREDIHKEKDIKNEIIDNKDKSNLDKLILDTEFNNDENEDVYLELDDLDQNLKNLQQERNIVDSYSDYHLKEEEIAQLAQFDKNEEINNDIQFATVKTKFNDINYNNDVDRFTEEKTMTNVERNKNYSSVTSTKYAENYSVKPKETNKGIEYKEKLYVDAVGSYFKNEDSGLYLGEYKTTDRGYRPVSKEKIENNQKLLNAIFDKYSMNNFNKSVTSSMMDNKKIPERKQSVGKFKPTPVYSVIHGSSVGKSITSTKSQRGVSSISTTNIEKNKSLNNVEKTQENNSIKKESLSGISDISAPDTEKNKSLNNVKKVKESNLKKKDTSKIEDSKPADIFKEIASQKETVWSISASKRVPKNKKTKK